jgi:hypothetical protein
MSYTPSGPKPKARLDPGLNAALAKAVTFSRLGEWAGVSRIAASKWDKIPVKRLAAIAKRSRIPKRVLRPDLYG